MKKQITLLSIFALLSWNSFSQISFSFIKNPVIMAGEVLPGEVYILNAGIKNSSLNQVTLVFNLISKDVPQGWSFSLCDPTSCHTPGPTSEKGESTLKGVEKAQLFEVNMLPKSAGVAVLEYEVYDKALPNLKQNVKFQFTANMPTNVEEQAIAASLKLYPIPATDVLYVTFDASATPQLNVSLTNALGSIVYEQNYQGTSNLQIPLANIPQGIYQLSIRNNNGKQIANQKVIKQ